MSVKLWYKIVFKNRWSDCEILVNKIVFKNHWSDCETLANKIVFKNHWSECETLANKIVFKNHWSNCETLANKIVFKNHYCDRLNRPGIKLPEETKDFPMGFWRENSQYCKREKDRFVTGIEVSHGKSCQPDPYSNVT